MMQKYFANIDTYLDIDHACDWLYASITGYEFSVSKIKVNSAIW